MGCAASKAAPVSQGSTGLKEDLRWSDDAFKKWTGYQIDGEYAIAWLRVGFIRRMARSKLKLGYRQSLPPGALYYGTPPDTVELFSCTYGWTAAYHPDPWGDKLQELYLLLEREGAQDHDLVFWDWCSLHQSPKSPTDLSVCLTERTAVQYKLFLHALRGMTLVFIYARIRVCVLPRTKIKGEKLEGVQYNETEYIKRGWCSMESILAAYSSRLVYSRGVGNEDVEDMMAKIIAPARVMRPEVALQSVKFTSKGDRDVVINVLTDHYGNMVGTPRDDVGFERFCQNANLAWVKVSTIRTFASTGGPFPRRQELPAGGYVEGVPPRHRRKFVVSHGWESEVHPSPSGARMKELAKVLADCHAKDEDLVFFDFCSNPQEAKMGRQYTANEPFEGAPPRSATAEPYFITNGVAYISGRTSEQDFRFRYAMWDMGRLYAYHGCEVIVLPRLQPKSTFPDGDVWGMENATPYAARGWCCSEFATTLASGEPSERIKNFHDPAVQEVLKSRRWPTTVEEYARLMAYTRRPELDGVDGLTYDAKLGVDFTSKGDRLVVQYNFFKMTFDPQQWARSMKGEVPPAVRA